MKKIYQNYLTDAQRLERRIHTLNGYLKLCIDEDEAKHLERRIYLLRVERYELKRDLKDIEKYLTPEELKEIQDAFTKNECA